MAMKRITQKWRWAALVAAATFGALIQLVVADGPGPGPSKYATDSPVYSGAKGSIRFNHARHADVACTACHAPALTSSRAADSLAPNMAVCATCHAGEKAPSPALETCGGCHVGHDFESKQPVRTAEDWAAVRPAPMPTPKSETALRFDHARHVTLTNSAGDPAGCTTCHGTSSEIKMPSMASCQSCHDGSLGGPSAECATCHATEKNVLKTDLSGGPLKPGNHSVAWLERHGTVAASNPDDCASCHITEEDCASCHVAQVAKPFAVHPPNYLAIHSVDARADQGSCTDCHRVETFCTSCHTEAKAVMRPIGRPPDRLEYHPQGWLDSTMPNNHGVMARRNLNECASCHVEDDCVSCHAGVNPHPANFVLECKQMVDANRAMCRRCHETIPPCL
jgi:hypothetical protein